MKHTTPNLNIKMRQASLLALLAGVLSIIVILMVAFGNGWKGFNISLVVPGIALAGVAVIQLLNGRKVG